MILLHQVHSLRPGAAAEFEEVNRDQLLPLVASEDGALCVLCGTDGSCHSSGRSDHHDRPRRRAGLGRVLYRACVREI